ncbi:hypothetical protein K502DRAFT_361680 [Neoconidiobolus thromboides FSU 785]|nr:hypothetical protein K502DRAFT_361680 [Neoconidiobolus thromboides FSU 785]
MMSNRNKDEMNYRGNRSNSKYEDRRDFNRSRTDQRFSSDINYIQEYNQNYNLGHLRNGRGYGSKSFDANSSEGYSNGHRSQDTKFSQGNKATTENIWASICQQNKKSEDDDGPFTQHIAASRKIISLGNNDVRNDRTVEQHFKQKTDDAFEKASKSFGNYTATYSKHKNYLTPTLRRTW